jgi:hypothetical protein
MTGAFAQRCCSAAAALRALLRALACAHTTAAACHQAAAGTIVGDSAGCSGSAAAAASGCESCTHHSGRAGSACCAAADGPTWQPRRQRRRCWHAARRPARSCALFPAALFAALFAALLALPGAAGESPAVTLTYFWIYKARAPTRATRGVCPACSARSCRPGGPPAVPSRPSPHPRRPPAVRAPTRAQGCYKDTNHNALGTAARGTGGTPPAGYGEGANTPNNTPNQCFKYAEDQGDNVAALQTSGQCWSLVKGTLDGTSLGTSSSGCGACSAVVGTSYNTLNTRAARRPQRRPNARRRSREHTLCHAPARASNRLRPAARERPVGHLGAARSLATTHLSAAGTRPDGAATSLRE